MSKVQAGDGTRQSLTTTSIEEELDETEITPFDTTDIVEEAEQLLRESAHHDFDVLIIGGGPGGCAAAFEAARVGARVGLIEARHIGGAGLNTGCLPMAIFLEAVSMQRRIAGAADYGLVNDKAGPIDIEALTAHKQSVVASMREATETALEAAGVHRLAGCARFVGPHTVEIEGDDARAVSAAHIVLAVGSRPCRPAVPGHDLLGVLTSDELFDSAVVAGTAIVVGERPLGYALATLLQGWGTHTTLLENSTTLLPGEDAQFVDALGSVLLDSGVQMICGATVQSIEATNGRLGVNCRLSHDGAKAQRMLQAQLVVTSRREPAVLGLGIDEIGIHLCDGLIEVDRCCQTAVPGVYAIGDCIRMAGSAALAVSDATLAVSHMLHRQPAPGRGAVPVVYATLPGAALVGLSAREAQHLKLNARVGVAHFFENQRARATAQLEGWVKMVIDADSEKLLGCQIVGPAAAELICQVARALDMGQTATEFAATTMAQPTLGEVLRLAALAAAQTNGGGCI